jgi:A/G-specific adenine glycosylase
MGNFDEAVIDEKIESFIETLSKWYCENKRHFPFRGQTDPYKIWVSEVLLQQTQIARGVKYYERFVTRFPTVNDLAIATWDEFFPYFKGLGYYNRGRNMLKTAKIVANDYAGRFPETVEELQLLPGVGSYTANAIMSFAFHKDTLPQDTNINRILGRVFLAVHSIDRKSTNSEALLAKILLGYKRTSSSEINQAMMDFGWQICSAKKPYCMFCPLQSQCLYFKKELPHYVRPKKMVPRDYTAKFPLAVIMHKKKVLVFGERLLGGLIEMGDERAFLKQIAQQQYGFEISVRTSYKTWITNAVKYSLHRCYIQLEDEAVEKLRPRVIEIQDIWRYIELSVSQDVSLAVE